VDTSESDPFILCDQVNILATVAGDEATNQVYNVAMGDRMTLNDLFELIRAGPENEYQHLKNFKPIYQDFRAGDVRHTLAYIFKVKNLLGYYTSHRIGTGN